MRDSVPFVDDINNRLTAYRPHIVRLPTRCGIKGGPVEIHSVRGRIRIHHPSF
jgi:hypothetical protein